MEYQSITDSNSVANLSVPAQDDESGRPEFPKLVLSDSNLGKHIPNTQVLTEEELRAQRRECFLGKTYNPHDSGHIDIKLSLVQSTEGVYLIAKGHLYWVYGEPGTRKTWLGLKVLQEANTLYIDLEAEPWTIGKRLKDMHIPYDKCALFYTPADPQDFKSSIQAITELDVDVVVIDSASGMIELCDVLLSFYPKEIGK